MLEGTKQKLASLCESASVALASASIGIASAGLPSAADAHTDDSSGILETLSNETPPERASPWNFENSLPEILKREGGITSDRADRGNRSITIRDFGLNQDSYDKFREQSKLLPRNILEISREELRHFYQSDFYEEAHAAEVTDPRLRLFLIDTAANVGEEHTVRLLQKALGGLKVDGDFGPATRAALGQVKDFPALVERVETLRTELYRGINERNALGVATNSGITQETYDRYRTDHQLPIQDVRKIDPQELKAIYRTYWDAVRCDEINDSALRLLMFDCAVLHGPANAVKLLQRALGTVTVDGKFGEKTREALNGVPDPQELRARLLDLRERFFDAIAKRDPSQERFLKGWKANRVDSLRELTQSFHALSHTVAPGDTLQGLAFRYFGNANSWEQIATTNNISLEQPRLRVGQQLSIPVEFSRYTIQPGDTLYKIARQELNGKGKWEDIARFNGMTNAQALQLQVGQEILLPKP
ncbi:MAG: LysM peptidoglycan-binding domain-containing protein [Bdellovibrionales bacterium]|nr:LysM peptidoglycan-binding domain-containing protein [Bdellovibrionales bacterium]